MMNRYPLLLLALLITAGCREPLPGGYMVSQADRGKAWLQNPDGTFTHGGMIKELYRNDTDILLVARPEGSGDKADRVPIDDTCYVALFIDVPKRHMQQITIAEAHRRKAEMSLVETYDRPCLRGMPNT